MIKSIILDSIDSTQDYLKKLLESQTSLRQEHILVISKNQTKGVGRTGNVWNFYPNSLALSFNLSPHKTLTLSSLEMAILVKDFIKKELNQNIKLKWPNDLFLENKKCGGIIINNTHHDLIVGLGINSISPAISNQSEITGLNFIDPIDFGTKLVQYIHSHRITDNTLIKRWEEDCFHLHKKVTIGTDIGIFKGLGKTGEALLEQENQKIKGIFSGTLRIIL